MRKLILVYSSMIITVGFGYFCDWLFRGFQQAVTNSVWESVYMLVPGFILMISGLLIFVNLRRAAAEIKGAGYLTLYLNALLLNLFFWPGFQLVFRVAFDVLRKQKLKALGLVVAATMSCSILMAIVLIQPKSEHLPGSGS